MAGIIPDKTLKLCSVPIGNFDDITLRVLKALRDAEVIVCEEYKPARRLLKHLEIDFYEGEFVFGKGRFLGSFNENTDREEKNYLQQSVFPKIKKLAYISDCGSPVFEDPGHSILTIAKGFFVEYLPGVTSLSALMMFLPEHIKRFEVLGFLSRKNEVRRQEIQNIKKSDKPVFLMETPYRMHKLLTEILENFPERNLLFGYRLSHREEKVLRGSVKSVVAQAIQMEQAEFVLFLHH